MASKPILDLDIPQKLETATFALGCFWSPDAQFGLMEGVVRTRVGYAGGTTDAPTYRTMGDHTESLQLDYDPQVISFDQLLPLFFDRHNPYLTPWKRQYASLVFYHTPEQHRLIDEKVSQLEQLSGKKVQTEVLAYDKFFLAEERHQKYKLQRHPALLAEYRSIYPNPQDFINSTAVARANGYVSGGINPELLLKQVGALGLSEKGQQLLLQVAMGG